jgi:hypothetical protein
MIKINIVTRPPRVPPTIAATLGVFDATRVPEVLVCTLPEGVGLPNEVDAGAISLLTRK